MSTELDYTLLRVCAELVIDPHDFVGQDPALVVPFLAAFAYAELFGVRYKGDLTERFSLDQLPTWAEEGWGDTSSKTDHPTS